MSSAAFAVATLIRRMKIEAANLFVIEKTSNVPDRNVVLDAGGERRFGSRASSGPRAWLLKPETTLDAS
jgi:hypothetical protein